VAEVVVDPSHASRRKDNSQLLLRLLWRREREQVLQLTSCSSLARRKGRFEGLDQVPLCPLLFQVLLICRLFQPADEGLSLEQPFLHVYACHLPLGVKLTEALLDHLLNGQVVDTQQVENHRVGEAKLRR